MSRAKTDVIVAVALLGFCLLMLVDARQIKDLGFAGMKPETWPLIVLWGLTLASGVFLVRSLTEWRREAPPADTPDTATPNGTPPATPKAKPDFGKYVNALWCFGLFLGFLLTLDYLGMLIGGILFAFLLFCAIGGITPRKVLLHAIVAILAIGVMWAIFAFGLGVVLPQGKIFHFM